MKSTLSEMASSCAVFLLVISSAVLAQETAKPGDDLLARAKAHFSRNERTQAHSLLDAICQQENSPAEAHSILGMVLLDPPFHDLSGARKAFDRALVVDPRDLYGNYGMGVLFNRTGDHVSAESFLRKATQIAPTFQDARYQLGVVLYQLEHPIAAAAEFRRATSLPGAVEYLALIAGKRQRPSEAADLIALLLRKMGPAWVERPRLLYQQSAFLIMASQREAAEPILAESIRLGFDRVEALNELAKLLYEKGENEKALALYRRATTATSLYIGKPRRLERGHAVAHFNVGVILYNAGDYPGTKAALNSALELDKFHENAWYKYGQCLRKLGQKKEAKVAFSRHNAIQTLVQKVNSVRQTLSEKPDDHKNRFELARVLVALERYEEAIAVLRALEYKKPDYPGLYAKFIEIARLAGREALARYYEAKLGEPKTDGSRK